jgi:hypothetical protein
MLHIVAAPLPALCAFVLIGTMVRAGGEMLPWQLRMRALASFGGPPPALTEAIRIAGGVLDFRLDQPFGTIALLPAWAWLSLYLVSLSLLAAHGISRGERWGGRVALGLASLEVVAMASMLVAYPVWLGTGVRFGLRTRSWPTMALGSGAATLLATALVIGWALWVVKSLRDPEVARALRPFDDREALRAVAILIGAAAVVMACLYVALIFFLGCIGMVLIAGVLFAGLRTAIKLWNPTAGALWRARAATLVAMVILGLSLWDEVEMARRGTRSLWPTLAIYGPLLALVGGLFGYLARPGLDRALRKEIAPRTPRMPSTR